MLLVFNTQSVNLNQTADVVYLVDTERLFCSI